MGFRGISPNSDSSAFTDSSVQPGGNSPVITEHADSKFIDSYVQPNGNPSQKLFDLVAEIEALSRTGERGQPVVAKAQEVLGLLRQVQGVQAGDLDQIEGLLRKPQTVGDGLGELAHLVQKLGKKSSEPAKSNPSSIAQGPITGLQVRAASSLWNLAAIHMLLGQRLQIRQTLQLQLTQVLALQGDMDQEVFDDEPTSQYSPEALVPFYNHLAHAASTESRTVFLQEINHALDCVQRIPIPHLKLKAFFDVARLLKKHPYFDQIISQIFARRFSELFGQAPESERPGLSLAAALAQSQTGQKQAQVKALIERALGLSEANGISLRGEQTRYFEQLGRSYPQTPEELTEVFGWIDRLGARVRWFPFEESAVSDLGVSGGEDGPEKIYSLSEHEEDYTRARLAQSVIKSIAHRGGSVERNYAFIRDLVSYERTPLTAALAVDVLAGIPEMHPLLQAEDFSGLPDFYREYINSRLGRSDPASDLNALAESLPEIEKAHFDFIQNPRTNPDPFNRLIPKGWTFEMPDRFYSAPDAHHWIQRQSGLWHSEAKKNGQNPSLVRQDIYVRRLKVSALKSYAERSTGTLAEKMDIIRAHRSGLDSADLFGLFTELFHAYRQDPTAIESLTVFNKWLDAFHRPIAELMMAALQPPLPEQHEDELESDDDDVSEGPILGDFLEESLAEDRPIIEIMEGLARLAIALQTDPEASRQVFDILEEQKKRIDEGEEEVSDELSQEMDLPFVAALPLEDEEQAIEKIKADFNPYYQALAHHQRALRWIADGAGRDDQQQWIQGHLNKAIDQIVQIGNPAQVAAITHMLADTLDGKYADPSLEEGLVESISDPLQRSRLAFRFALRRNQAPTSWFDPQTLKAQIASGELSALEIGRLLTASQINKLLQKAAPLSPAQVVALVEGGLKEGPFQGAFERVEPYLSDLSDSTLKEGVFRVLSQLLRFEDKKAIAYVQAQASKLVQVLTSLSEPRLLTPSEWAWIGFLSESAERARPLISLLFTRALAVADRQSIYRLLMRQGVVDGGIEELRQYLRDRGAEGEFFEMLETCYALMPRLHLTRTILDSIFKHVDVQQGDKRPIEIVRSWTADWTEFHRMPSAEQRVQALAAKPHLALIYYETEHGRVDFGDLALSFNRFYEMVKAFADSGYQYAHEPLEQFERALERSRPTSTEEKAALRARIESAPSLSGANRSFLSALVDAPQPLTEEQVRAVAAIAETDGIEHPDRLLSPNRQRVFRLYHGLSPALTGEPNGRSYEFVRRVRPSGETQPGETAEQPEQKFIEQFQDILRLILAGHSIALMESLAQEFNVADDNLSQEIQSRIQQIIQTAADSQDLLEQVTSFHTDLVHQLEGKDKDAAKEAILKERGDFFTKEVLDPLLAEKSHFLASDFTLRRSHSARASMVRLKPNQLKPSLDDFVFFAPGETEAKKAIAAELGVQGGAIRDGMRVELELLARAGKIPEALRQRFFVHLSDEVTRVAQDRWSRVRALAQAATSQGNYEARFVPKTDIYTYMRIGDYRPCCIATDGSMVNRTLPAYWKDRLTVVFAILDPDTNKAVGHMISHLGVSGEVQETSLFLNGLYLRTQHRGASNDNAMLGILEEFAQLVGVNRLRHGVNPYHDLSRKPPQGFEKQSDLVRQMMALKNRQGILEVGVYNDLGFSSANLDERNEHYERRVHPQPEGMVPVVSGTAEPVAGAQPIRVADLLGPFGLAYADRKAKMEETLPEVMKSYEAYLEAAGFKSASSRAEAPSAWRAKALASALQQASFSDLTALMPIDGDIREASLANPSLSAYLQRLDALRRRDLTKYLQERGQDALVQSLAQGEIPGSLVDVSLLRKLIAGHEDFGRDILMNYYSLIKMPGKWISHRKARETYAAGMPMRVFLECGDQRLETLASWAVLQMEDAEGSLKALKNLIVFEGHDEEARREMVALDPESLIGNPDALPEIRTLLSWGWAPVDRLCYRALGGDRESFDILMLIIEAKGQVDPQIDDRLSLIWWVDNDAFIPGMIRLADLGYWNGLLSVLCLVATGRVEPSVLDRVLTPERHALILQRAREENLGLGALKVLWVFFGAPGREAMDAEFKNAVDISRLVADTGLDEDVLPFLETLPDTNPTAVPTRVYSQLALSDSIQAAARAVNAWNALQPAQIEAVPLLKGRAAKRIKAFLSTPVRHLKGDVTAYEAAKDLVTAEHPQGLEVLASLPPESGLTEGDILPWLGRYEYYFVSDESDMLEKWLSILVPLAQRPGFGNFRRQLFGDLDFKEILSVFHKDADNRGMSDFEFATLILPLEDINPEVRGIYRQAKRELQVVFDQYGTLGTEVKEEYLNEIQSGDSTHYSPLAKHYNKMQEKLPWRYEEVDPKTQERKPMLGLLRENSRMIIAVLGELTPVMMDARGDEQIRYIAGDWFLTASRHLTEWAVAASTSEDFAEIGQLARTYASQLQSLSTRRDRIRTIYFGDEFVKIALLILRCALAQGTEFSSWEAATSYVAEQIPGLNLDPSTIRGCKFEKHAPASKLRLTLNAHIRKQSLKITHQKPASRLKPQAVLQALLQPAEAAGAGAAVPKPTLGAENEEIFRWAQSHGRHRFALASALTPSVVKLIQDQGLKEQVVARYAEHWSQILDTLPQAENRVGMEGGGVIRQSDSVTNRALALLSREVHDALHRLRVPIGMGEDQHPFVARAYQELSWRFLDLGLIGGGAPSSIRNFTEALDYAHTQIGWRQPHNREQAARLVYETGKPLEQMDQALEERRNKTWKWGLAERPKREELMPLFEAAGLSYEDFETKSRIFLGKRPTEDNKALAAGLVRTVLALEAARQRNNDDNLKTQWCATIARIARYLYVHTYAAGYKEPGQLVAGAHGLFFKLLCEEATHALNLSPHPNRWHYNTWEAVLNYAKEHYPSVGYDGWQEFKQIIKSTCNMWTWDFSARVPVLASSAVSQSASASLPILPAQPDETVPVNIVSSNEEGRSVEGMEAPEVLGPEPEEAFGGHPLGLGLKEYTLRHPTIGDQPTQTHALRNGWSYLTHRTEALKLEAAVQPQRRITQLKRLRARSSRSRFTHSRVTARGTQTRRARAAVARSARTFRRAAFRAGR